MGVSVRAVPTALVLASSVVAGEATTEVRTKIAESVDVHEAIRVLVRAGDEVPEHGTVVSIGRVAVNDAGSWIVEVRTDNPDPTRDQVILHNGVVAWYEGQPLPMLDGTPRIRHFEAFAINAAGDTCWDLSLEGTPGGELDDSVLFFNSTLVLQEGWTMGSQGAPLPTAYQDLLTAKLNGRGDALLLSDVLRPAGPQRVLMHLELGDTGGLALETPVAMTGDTPPALLGDTLLDIYPAPHSISFNERGDAAYVARATQTAGGAYAILCNDRLIAREGDPCAAEPERDWERLIGTTIALSDTGSILYRGDLSGDSTDDDVLVLDDRILAREGDLVETSIGTFPIRGFAYTTPLGLGSRGDALFFAFLNKPFQKHVVAILDGRIILQEGVTPAGETWIESIIEPPHLEFADLSPNASKLLIECRLAYVGEAAVLVDFARLPERFCNDAEIASCPCYNAGHELAGCDNSGATGGVRLRLVDQETTPRNRATLVADGLSQEASATVLLRGESRYEMGRVFGDGLLCLEAPVVRLSTSNVAGGLSSHTVGHGPAAGAGKFHYQLWYPDGKPGYCDPTSRDNLSSGRTLRWE